jgi:hypothetical protein
LPPPSVGLGFASAERASPRSESWKIEAPPPSRSEKRRHPVITCISYSLTLLPSYWSCRVIQTHLGLASSARGGVLSLALTVYVIQDPIRPPPRHSG